MNRLAVQWFDGRSARARAVLIHVFDGHLYIEGDGAVLQRVPLGQVRWPERTRHGERQAHLAGGGTLSSADGPAWDAWAREQDLKEPLTVRWQQSWRGVLVALVATVAVLWGAWAWGVPAAASGALALTPASVDTLLGDQAMAQFDREWLAPSTLPAARQQALRAAFEKALATARPDHTATPWRLHFRGENPKHKLGPNAFALPGGHIVLTDAMVKLLDDRPEVIVGVLAHEWGHVHHRHGMRMLVQAGLVGALAGLVVGDFSSLLAAAPAVLAQQGYSRDFEREADAVAHQVLQGSGTEPKVMVTLFDRLDAALKPSDKGARDGLLAIGLASHPTDDERRRFFSQPR